MFSTALQCGFTSPRASAFMPFMRGRPRTKTEPKYRNNVAALRARAGMTQAQLAEAAGIGAKAIGKIDRGETRLNQTNLDKLSRALGVSVRELLADDTGAPPASIGIPPDMAEDIMRRADELAVMLADKLPANEPLGDVRRAKLISDVAALFRAAASQILKGSGRT